MVNVNLVPKYPSIMAPAWRLFVYLGLMKGPAGRKCWTLALALACAVGLVLLARAIPANAQEHAAPATAKEVEKLKLETDRLVAVNAIQNVIGRYSFYHLATMYSDKRYLDLYANGDPGLRLEISSRGIWEGPEAAKRMLQSFATQLAGGGGPAGVLSLHPVSSPVIEVAGDGQTARSAWLSIGSEAGVHGGMTLATWIAVKYCADFKKMDGGWKIWHMLTRGIYLTSYDKPMTERQPLPPRPPTGKPSGADRPSDPPDELYTTSTVQKLVPEPPSPYQTWDESMACVK